MSSEPLFELSNAGIRRQGRWLVRGVTLTMRGGEIVTLIGPNGSGKSSTARLALGLVAPDEGSARRRPGLRVGYVPQSLAVDRTLPLSVARFMELTSRPGRAAIRAALEACGVAGREGSPLAALSGGELQRVMLARAAASRPDLLVLDEPTGGVDFAGEVALYETIVSLRDRLGCGVLLISHDLHVVMAATDRVLCLNGHVCCEGPPLAVAGSESFRTLFGARAAEAVALYRHEHDHTHLPDGRVRHADGAITESCHPGDGHHGHDGHHDHHDHDGHRGHAGYETRAGAQARPDARPDA